jgi:phytoene dehydrogenase-like protein
MNTESGVIVVGAGHHALTCAAYLAEAGLKVTVLGGRDVIGGNTASEELTLPGWLDYRTDIEGLYLTGSTSHPGGSVSGRPGRNSAREVMKDLGIDSSTMMSRP